MLVIHIDPPVMIRFALLPADWSQGCNLLLQKSTTGVGGFENASFVTTNNYNTLQVVGRIELC
jgi:hypothetical protein